jgi:hypothetical protein
MGYIRNSMSGYYSAYAVLGLRPGAPRAEVDDAYRRLIKRYHPDRTGGDCSRAAEINRAYTLLRRGSGPPVRPSRSVPVPVTPRRRPRRPRTGLLLASFVVALGAAAIANEMGAGGFDRRAFAGNLDWTPAYHPVSSSGGSPLLNLDEPLETLVIDNAIAAAVKFHAQGDRAASAEYSRTCHTSLRDQPSLAWFDSCVAFDEATVVLTGAQLFPDSGPFDPPSVMARQFGSARHLSGDMLAADSRLNQIRSRVEMALVPRLAEAASPQP